MRVFAANDDSRGRHGRGVGRASTALAADQPDLVYRQAGQAIHRGDYDAAIRQLDEAIRSAPKEAKLRGLRGVAWLRKGDYARGAADLKAAIELNPGDAGAQYQSLVHGGALGRGASARAKSKSSRMLHDRPAMAQFGEEAEFLRGWAARKFAGEDFAEPIDWDPSPPLHSDAEHLAPAGDAHAAILVEENYTEGPKAGKPRPFEELWAGAVYELYNVTYSREFVRLNDEADEGKVSKEAFVGGILKYELLAAQRTRAFYVNVFLPWAEKKKLPTDPALWFCDWWDTRRARPAELHRQVGVSLASLRADVRLGHGPPPLARRRDREGPKTPEGNAGGGGLRGRSSRRCPIGSGGAWPG